MEDRQPASRLILAWLLLSFVALRWQANATTVVHTSPNSKIGADEYGLLRRLAALVPANGEGLERRDAFRADVVVVEGSGQQRRRLASQTCIGTNSLRIGCALQWGLPQCCDSNPNSGSSYNCQPPLLGNCPSGMFAACCTP
ncbi:g5452 [Coccomyxa elongata]